MSQVSRVVIAWNGAPVVGPGVSVLHCTVGGEHALMAAFRAMCDSVKNLMPSGLQWSFPGSGVVLTAETGVPVDSWVDGSPPAPLAATLGQTWTNGVGLRIKWTTGAIFAGRHVVGSTFFVPLTVGSYEGAGNIVDATLTTFTTAASTFVGAAGLRVYSRPRPLIPGQSFAVNGFNVPDKVSWLRGRRT